jgi:hypothetical protein
MASLLGSELAYYLSFGFFLPYYFLLRIRPIGTMGRIHSFYRSIVGVCSVSGFMLPSRLPLKPGLVGMHGRLTTPMRLMFTAAM